jgi:pimeloyl-ACP methyl ester carboxylesterase
MNKQSLFYTWKNYRCAYEFHEESAREKVALLLIHPIGVGLSCEFWHPFIKAWLKVEKKYPIYNPDLLGCGDSDLPKVAYFPTDWADQLSYFITHIIKIPVIIVTQGGLFPIAIDLINNCPQPELIKGLILASPPTIKYITEDKPYWQQKLSWNLFLNSPIGTNFYRYARRRKFLENFSIRQLFANKKSVDDQWLNTLERGAENIKTRYAVFSFLAGFWRQDYQERMGKVNQPTLIVMGDKTSSVGKNNKPETPEERLNFYLNQFTDSEGLIISGRNVLPYESPLEFVSAGVNFVNKLP